MNHLYRRSVFVGTFFTGMTGLVFQVLWQRYLSYVLGSESRSVSLVVAIFLLGLASGYLAWGQIAERIKSRRKLLKIYGWAECAIGIYAILFPLLFEGVSDSARSLPPNIFLDLVIAAALLFVPTFLMGATIPILTAVLPENVNEVNSTHARVYGINTLGAFLGTFLGAFFFIPRFGLPLSLLICGLINVGIGVLFVGNRLAGEAKKAEDIPIVANRLPSLAIYFFVFVIGCVSIAFEVLFVRILNLVIGASYAVFPIVVGTYVLGLAAGSLWLAKSSRTLEGIFRSLLWLIVYLLALFLTIPYWPYWAHCIRVTFSTTPTSYPVYMFFISVMFAALTFPFLIPMGRLLPAGYSLIRKTGSDYGKVCGRIYFCNTLGTVVGAVLLGHLLLHWLDLPGVYRFSVSLIAMISAYFMFIEKRLIQMGAAIALMIFAFLAPDWNRAMLDRGIYRNPAINEESFAGIFVMPAFKDGTDYDFVDDDPNTSVAVSKSMAKPGILARSIAVNGKSDGNTYFDYTTMASIAALGYLFAPDRGDLDAVVIGLGTGITSGNLSQLAQIRSLTTLEISPAVIQAAPMFDPYTQDLTRSPKFNVQEMDAFRYFARSHKKLDIIISEPSNPWVIGIENLYTLEFYEKARESLADDGVLVQWIHSYDLGFPSFNLIADNIYRTFEDVHMFLMLGPAKFGDLALVVRKKPKDWSSMQSRLKEPEVQNLLARLGIAKIEQLQTQEIFDSLEFGWIPASRPPTGTHSLMTPRLGFSAAVDFFMSRSLDLISQYIRGNSGATRLLRKPGSRGAALLTLIREGSVCPKETVNPDFCTRNEQLLHTYRTYKGEIPDTDRTNRLKAYRVLREEGFIEMDLDFLNDYLKRPLSKELVSLVLQELTQEAQWQLLEEWIGKLTANGTLNETSARAMRAAVSEGRRDITAVVDAFGKYRSTDFKSRTRND